MGRLVSGSVNLTRFRIVEPVSRDLLNEVPQRLRAKTFLSIDDIAEEKAYGWTNIDDMLDTEWKSSPPEKGEFFAFSLRMDRRKIPPAVLKKAFTLALREEEARIKEQGKKFVSRERKRELREQAKLRLLGRVPAVPLRIDAAWNTTSGEVWFASTSTPMVKVFSMHFFLTFDLHIEPLAPYTMLDSRYDFDSNPDVELAVDRLVPTRFVA